MVVRVTLKPQNIATGTTWTPADRFSTKNGLPNDPKSSPRAAKMCSRECRGRFWEPLGDPFGSRHVPTTRSFIFPSESHRVWRKKLAPGGHLCSPAPGPRKASLDQVLHYFRSQKPQLAGPQGRRIREACGHMRRPWKRDGPSTFPARRNASSPKNCRVVSFFGGLSKFSNPKICPRHSSTPKHRYWDNLDAGGPIFDQK